MAAGLMVCFFVANIGMAHAFCLIFQRKTSLVETLIVYLDDADYALPMLQSVASTPQGACAHWVLVACAPRITHRASKFVSNRSRESWRSKWAEKLFGSIEPALQATGAQTTSILARVPLPDLLEELKASHGADVQVVDLRRPKQAETAAPSLLSTVGVGLRRTGTALASVLAVFGVLIEETLVI